MGGRRRRLNARCAQRSAPDCYGDFEHCSRDSHGNVGRTDDIYVLITLRALTASKGSTSRRGLRLLPHHARPPVLTHRNPPVPRIKTALSESRIAPSRSQITACANRLSTFRGLAIA